VCQARVAAMVAGCKMRLACSPPHSEEMNVISIGEVLWDVAGQEEFLGGAPLNFAIHLGYLGHRVSLVSGVGRDERGRRVRQRLAEAGLSTAFIHEDPLHATGWVGVSFNSDSEPEYEIHRPAAYDFPELSEGQWGSLLAEPVSWIYFGTLQQMSPAARLLTDEIIGKAPGAKRFYDPNLRPRSYNPEVVRYLLERATVVKLNEKEAETIAAMLGATRVPLQDFCRTLLQRFGWDAVCVTLGAAGCAALIGGEYVEAEAYRITVADTVGAGDAFAAAFLHGFSAGWPAGQIADFSNRVAALVASRASAVPRWTLAEANALRIKAGSGG
jgi:fructokinase